MWNLSKFLVLFFIATLAVSIDLFYHGRLAHGFEALGVSSFAVAVLWAFVLPVKCRVTTKRGHPCPNWAYGVLFGCSQAAGHSVAKLYARLGWQQEAVRAVTPDKGTYAAARPAPQGPRVTAVTIADSRMDKCNLCIALVSMVGTVAGVIIPIMGFR